jgi:hypothetical protein
MADHEEIEAAFRGAAEAYRTQGLVAARPLIVSSEAITERLVSVEVLWDYLDEQGHSAQQDAYRYLLRIDSLCRRRLLAHRQPTSRSCYALVRR